MDQWMQQRGGAASQQTALSHLSQQQQQQPQQAHQQAPQYVYSSNSYSGQQGAAPSSAASAAYVQQQSYTQQTYGQQNYGQQNILQNISNSVQHIASNYSSHSVFNVQQQQQQQQPPAVAAAQYGGLSTYNAVGGPSQQQSAQPQSVPWSQQASAPTAQPSDQQQGAYGRSSTGVASAASGGGSSVGAGQYGGQYGSVYGAAAQSNTQQLLGPSGRGVASPEFQTQGAAVSRGSAAYGAAQDRAMNTGASYVVGGAASVSASGVYGADAAKYDDTDKYGTGASSASYDGKGGDYGAASSPSAYNQKAADQYGANYNIKSSDYSQSERGQYGHNQAAYGQAESQAAVGARRYQETHSAMAVVQAQQRQQQHQQQDRQDQQSQILRQQQVLQAQQAQANAVLLNRGAASSVLDAGGRNQAEYLAASRNVPARVAGAQEYGGQVRALLGQTYGVNRSDTDPGLLVSQYGVAGGGRSTGNAGNSTGYGAQQQQAAMYGGLNAGRGIQGQMYPHNPPAVGYGGVQLPPGREYSAGRGTGGGGYIAGGSRSDRPSIGSSRFEDRRDDRGPPRRDGLRDDRRGGRDRDRDRARGGNRDRERDRDRERREEQRKRERSPVRPVRDHKELPPSKRDDRSSRKESPRRDQPHRVSSPAKEKRREYLCKVEPYIFGEAERDYTSLCKRYSKLFVVPEFAKLVVSWTGKDSQISLDQPISFEHDAVDVEDEGESKQAPPKSSDKILPSSATNSAKGTTTWNAKVMLMSGASEAALNELLVDENPEDKPPHLHNLLKFVALRKDRSAIMAAGGAWDKDLDGGDPAVDEGALIRTAIRCTKQATQLDLSDCKSWVRFLEVHYERPGEDGLPSHREVTVMFLPDLSSCLPSLGDWHQQCTLWRQSKLGRDGQAKGEKDGKLAESKTPVKEGDSNGSIKDGETETLDDSKDREEKKEKDVEEKIEPKEEEVEGKEKLPEVKVEEELPQQSGFVLTTQRTKTTKMRSMTISLDGLLDYDEEDREECTFELSVFAEIYQEMLQYKMGSLILSDLEMLRETTYARKKEERKRGRSEGKDEIFKDVEGEGSSSRKRSKFSDRAGTPEPKVDQVKVEAVPESKVESVPEIQAEVVAEPKVEDVPEGRIEIEASDILNANSEEELRKLQARREEAAMELEKTKAEGHGEKAEENGVAHKDEKKEDGLNLSAEGESAKVGKDSVIGDDMDVAITSASSDVDMKDAAASKDRGLEDKIEEQKLEKKHIMGRDVLQAYRYFDRNRVGYLKADDLRRILHGLGKFLSQRNVKDLVACAVSESSKSRDERIVYLSFTEKDAPVELHG